MTFQDQVPKAFVTRFNKNKQGIRLKAGQFIQQSQENFVFREKPNSQITIITDYVPGMFTTLDTPKGIKGKDMYEWTWTLTVALSGEDENLSPQIEQRAALDFFRQDLINNPIFTLNIDGTTYRAITLASNISLVSETIILNKEKRTIVSMNIPMQSGIGAFFNNDVIVSLKKDGGSEFFELKVADNNHSYNKIPSGAFPLISGETTLNKATDSSYGYNTVALYEDNEVMNEIVSEILIKGTGNLNKKYTQQTVFTPIGTIPKRTVLLTGGALGGPPGDTLLVGFDITDTI